jgi:hypothetical protein
MLLNDECYPTTSEIGFIEIPLAEAAATFKKQIQAVRLRERHHTGPLRDALNELLPLTSQRVRMLFVQTVSRWTAYFDSSWRGTDCFPIIANLAEDRCMGMKVSADPRFGTIWDVYGPKGVDDLRLMLNTVRHISATDEGVGNWEFSQAGQPFAFEQTAHYSARKIRDRFHVELLVEYLQHFDIDLFNADFYRGPAILFEMQLYRHLSLLPSRLPRINVYPTFAAAREDRPSRNLFYLSHWRSTREMDRGIRQNMADITSHFSRP